MNIEICYLLQMILKNMYGIIMYDETIRQKTTSSNQPFPEYLNEKGVLTGIKVDTGAKELAGSNNEENNRGIR